jgi:hypothetical protein
MAKKGGFAEFYVDAVLEAFIYPEPTFRVSVVMRLKSGKEFAVRFSQSALTSLETRVAEVREQMSGKHPIQ